MRAGVILLILMAAIAKHADTDVRRQLDAIAQVTVAAVVDGNKLIVNPPLDGAPRIHLVSIQAPISEPFTFPRIIVHPISELRKSDGKTR